MYALPAAFLSTIMAEQLAVASAKGEYDSLIKLDRVRLVRLVRLECNWRFKCWVLSWCWDRNDRKRSNSSRAFPLLKSPSPKEFV